MDAKCGWGGPSCFDHLGPIVPNLKSHWCRQDPHERDPDAVVWWEECKKWSIVRPRYSWTTQVPDNFFVTKKQTGFLHSCARWGLHSLFFDLLSSHMRVLSNFTPEF